MFNNERGQTLLELIVVMSISVIMIGALVSATIFSLRNAQFSKNQAQATKLAQEGLELVRIGRDTDKPINGLVLGSNTVTSWKGNDGDCSTNTSALWCNRLNGLCGNTSNPDPNEWSYCYFNVTRDGILNPLTAHNPSQNQPIPANTEEVGQFNRTVIISDDDQASSRIQKTITVVVTWTDFSGFHESKLTTLLRKK